MKKVFITKIIQNKLFAKGTHFNKNIVNKHFLTKHAVVAQAYNYWVNILSIPNILKQLQKTITLITNIINKNKKIIIALPGVKENSTLENNYKLHYQTTIYNQWLPGTLTNFKKLRKSKSIINNTNYTHFKKLKKIPQLIIILNNHNFYNISWEAYSLGIPSIVFITQENNPSKIYIPIISTLNYLPVINFYSTFITKILLFAYAKSIYSFKRNNKI